MPAGEKKETAVSGPWQPTQPYLENILSRANTLYDRNKNKSMLAPMDSRTKEGLRMTTSLARQGVPNMGALYDMQGNMLSNNGMTSGMSEAAGILGGYANDNGLTPELRQTAGYLDDFASGQYHEDPRMLEAIKAREERTANALTTRFGRGYGSAAIGDSFARGMAEAGNELMLTANENSRNRQLQSAGILGNMYSDAANRGLSAAGAMGSLYSQGADNMGTWAAMSPMFNEMRHDGAARLASVGDVYHQYAQSRYDAPFDRLAQASGFVTPMAGMGKIVNATKAGPSSAQGILGGAMTGAKMGQSFGGWGTLLGGVGGGILGGGWL